MLLIICMFAPTPRPISYCHTFSSISLLFAWRIEWKKENKEKQKKKHKKIFENINGESEFDVHMLLLYFCLLLLLWI
jgi:hypothetical protein